MTNDAAEPRAAGPTNGRDLAGLGTADGRQIRPGLVYRSDDTGWGLGTRAAELPAQAATAVDLRRPEEVAQRGLPWFVGEGTTRVPKNLSPVGTVATTITDEVALGTFYARLFEAQRLNLGEIMRELATDAEVPAVIYCVAGKDRTGVVVATLGMLLGIRQEELIADYHRSAAFMDGVRATGQLRGAEEEGVVLPLHAAPPRAIALFLDHVTARYPSADELTEALSLPQATLLELRRRLLTPNGSATGTADTRPH
ncbi:MAG: tyrosine-protein phosphatase [Candidatus Dormiibacterota bacterium]